jgi:regulator of sigma E protease
MLTILSFVITISILVFIHEFGHYYVARIFGIKIEQFSIGFGKELYSKVDKHGTKWSISLIPLGGFVKMYGDKDVASSSHRQVQHTEKAFYNKPLYARFLVVAAGPLANYLLAVIIFAGMFFAYGKFEIPAVVEQVITGSPAEKAGLQPGDRIIQANGSDVKDFNDLQKIVIINAERPVNLSIKRNSDVINVSVIPTNRVFKDTDIKAKVGYIGVTANTEGNYIKLGILGSFYAAVNEAIDTSLLTLKLFSQMLVGQRSLGEIGGPVTIAKESGKSFGNGFVQYILFLAMLSINLGLVNLLPIPVLDGGHLAMMGYEAIARKPLSEYAQGIFMKLGISVIIFLIVISISNDIRNLIW